MPLLPGKTEYTIVMQKDVLRLEAQVVTGVATTVASQNAANAVAVVTQQDVNEVPAPTIENSIQGKIPGAVIQSNNGGAPGGGMQIQIRGITSINGNALPLYVIDGVMVDNETVNADDNAINEGRRDTRQGSASRGAERAGQRRQPHRRHQSRRHRVIEILKGASASAIYGSKASAGVVIITTKQGTTGKPKWNVSGQVGHSRWRTIPSPAIPHPRERAGVVRERRRATTPTRRGRGGQRVHRVVYAGPQNYPNAAVWQFPGVVPDRRQCQRHLGHDAVLPVRPLEVRQRHHAEHGVQQAVGPLQRHRAVRAASP